jgi:SAM-dependent methyltransferase
MMNIASADLASDVLVSNRNTYGRVDVVREFTGLNGLFPPERAIFDGFADQIASWSVLDLGIGAGRTTEVLYPVSRRYVGIDYVAEFVDIASRRFPNADLREGNACDLSCFGDESFDLVVFSFNGLDCVSPSERPLALKEILRVLRPGGFFVFSSHNRDYRHFNKLPWQRWPEMNTAFLKYLMYCLWHYPKHRRMKHLEFISDTNALLNDPDHRYSLLLYYVTIEQQKTDLQVVGFADVDAFDSEGNIVSADTESHWIYYRAMKPAQIRCVPGSAARQRSAELADLAR